MYGIHSAMACWIASSEASCPARVRMPRAIKRASATRSSSEDTRKSGDSYRGDVDENLKRIRRYGFVRFGSKRGGRKWVASVMSVYISLVSLPHFPQRSASRRAWAPGNVEPCVGLSSCASI